MPTDDILKQHYQKATYRYEYPLAHLLKSIPSDVYELRLALPEGAKILSYSTGELKPDNVTNDLSFSYLDYLGRPTLVFTFKNYLPRVHGDVKLVVDYTLDATLIWIEPIYLVVGLLLCFGLYIAYSKMDLSFGSDQLKEDAELVEASKHRTTAARRVETRQPHQPEKPTQRRK